MEKLMTPLAVIFFIVISVISLNWYTDLNEVDYKIREYEDRLSKAEIIELDLRRVLKRPIDYDKEYFTRRTITYKVTRSSFPLKYNRDTVSDSGINYFSRER